MDFVMGSLLEELLEWRSLGADFVDRQHWVRRSSAGLEGRANKGHDPRLHYWPSRLKIGAPSPAACGVGPGLRIQGLNQAPFGLA